VGDEGITKLYERYKSHYGEFMRKDNPREVDFDFIFGLKTSRMNMELRYLLGLALDEGVPLYSFEEFGIVYSNDGTYEIEYEKHPHLALPRNLFLTLTTKQDVEFFTRELISRGFRQTDLAILEKYLEQYPMNKTPKTYSYDYFTYLSGKMSELTQTVKHKNQLPPAKYRQIMGQPRFARDYISYKIQRNWALTLLAKLDPQRQRILKSFLMERLTSKTNSHPSGPPDDFSYLEQQLLSGERQKQMDRFFKLNPNRDHTQ
jgi:hypothetical protein